MSVRLMTNVFQSDPSRIQTQEKIVMLALADCANDDGLSIYPSVATLQWKTSLSERSVRRSLSTLRESGLITVKAKSKANFPTEYNICTSVLKSMVLEGCPPGPPTKDSGVPNGPSGVPNRPPEVPAWPPIRTNHQEPSSSESSLNQGNATEQSVRPPIAPTPPLQEPQGGPTARPPAQDPSGRPIVAGSGTGPKPVKESWLTVYGQAWSDVTKGGILPFSHIAKDFKILEAKFGRDRLIEAWKKYLRSTDPAFLSGHAFSAKAGLFMGPEVRQDKGTYVTDEDRRNYLKN